MSLNSFESGGLFGKGIGEGLVAKGLPDVHSDFIFALIGFAIVWVFKG